MGGLRAHHTKGTGMLDTNFLMVHRKSLLRYARRLTRDEDEAMDLLQDTNLLALSSLQRTALAPCHPRAWLASIMRNHWHRVSREKRMIRMFLQMMDGSQMTDCQLQVRLVTSSQFCEAWDRLPADGRMIIEKCLIDGESYNSVARLYGMPESTVGTLVHRTRRQLEALLG